MLGKTTTHSYVADLVPQLRESLARVRCGVKGPVHALVPGGGVHGFVAVPLAGRV